MKIRIALTALALAATTLAISSSPSAAASPDALTVSNNAPIANEHITVSGTISDLVARPVTLERLNVDGSTWDPVAPTPAATTSSSGVFSFSYKITESQQIRVHAEPFVEGATSYDDKTTPVVALTLTPTTGVLEPIVDGSSAKATVAFQPVRKDQPTELQVLTIQTTNTNEVPIATWKKVASGKQDLAGKTTFTLSDPYEVSHKYRAVTTPSAGKGDPTASNDVTYAAAVTPKNTGLSAIYFNTNEGASVNTRTRYFEGEFSMSGSSKISACAPVGTVAKSTMKGRGNYSWSFAKKSFTLKINDKKNLCGMGSSKKWALVANAYDKSLLRSAVAFNLGSKLTNMAWTPKATPVDLYVNGSYRGSYSLVERISIQAPKKLTDVDPNKRETARVNIDELKAGDGDKVDGVAIPVGQRINPDHPNNQEPNITGGYLLEWDFRKGADQNVQAGSRGWVGIKDPENDLDAAGQMTNAGISPQQKKYIDDYLDAADKALFGAGFKDDTNGWRKYINIDSAVDYYIGMEMMKPVDGNMWASVYMYKPRGQKLEFGPMWDFDLAAGSANRAGNTVGTSGWYLRNVISTSAKQSSKTWFNRLNEDGEFRDAVKARWKVLYNDLDSSNFIDEQKAILTASADENFKKWSVTEHLSSSQVVKGSWAKEITYLRSWMNSRRSWMNSQY